MNDLNDAVNACLKARLSLTIIKCKRELHMDVLQKIVKHLPKEKQEELN
jgi:hypothetical protein